MEDRCVCCGAIIPEGRMVCLMCEMEVEDGRSRNGAEAGAGGPAK